VPASTRVYQDFPYSRSKTQSDPLRGFQHHRFRQHAVKSLLPRKLSSNLYQHSYGSQTLNGVRLHSALTGSLQTFWPLSHKSLIRQALASLHFDATLIEIPTFPLVPLRSLSRFSRIAPTPTCLVQDSRVTIRQLGIRDYRHRTFC